MAGVAGKRRLSIAGHFVRPSLIFLVSSLLVALGQFRGWATPISRNIAGTAAIAAMSLLYCCGIEFHALANKITIPLSSIAITMIIVGLQVMTISCIAFALNDSSDPIRLSVRTKEAHDYIAEVLAAILVLHVRSTMPWLFLGLILALLAYSACRCVPRLLK